MRLITHSVLLLVLCLSSVGFSISDSNNKLYSNTWAIQIDGGRKVADRIAQSHGYTNLGPLGTLEGFYVFRHDKHPRRSRRSVEGSTKKLRSETHVKWAEQQVIKRRVKRGYNPNLNDPLFHEQWFLHNTVAHYQGYDHNVLPVWQQGIYGRDVVVSILDDGIEYTHTDLRQNYDKLASFDFNSNDDDPIPRATWNNENRHGTRCAGEVAAQFNNSVCTAGVAPMAKVGGVRMLDGDVTDAVEAWSLSLQPQHIEIYSASWGPDDDGRTVDGPARLARMAFTDGIEKGRGGLGSIYVWASGNGGRSQDNCNCDGYTNSIYTLSISSATEHGQSPWYSESCSSTLATAFSSGSYGVRKIVTTDLNNGCTTSHTGTSASAPLAAGILALALEVNRNLTWRDMQHIVVRTASMDKLLDREETTNGVGRRVSHKFGYGLLDALALVNMARIWKTVPHQRVCLEIPSDTARTIPDSRTLTVTTEAAGCVGTPNQIRYLEHVECIITLDSAMRGDLSIYLISPRGTRSTLLGKRVRDNSRNGFYNWAFMTTHSWEENPVGTWTLEIMNEKSSNFFTGSKPDVLKTWELKFYGTYEDPNPDTIRKQPVPACDVECEGGCTGPQADHCNGCKHYKKNITGECVASCGNGNYADDVTKQCRPCSFTCATCDGPTSSDCLSCHSPLLLQSQLLSHPSSSPHHPSSPPPHSSVPILHPSPPHSGKCVNLCPQGWFKSASTCMKCDSTCKSCTATATQCTECPPKHKLVNSKCTQDCPPGEFLDASKCSKCHPSCESCDKSDHLGCTKCGVRTVSGKSSKLFLLNGECKASCPAGRYPDDGSQECRECHASCSSCAGAGMDQCTACASGLVRVGSPQGSCSQSCPKGQFSAHGICASCDAACATCSASNPKKCTSCPDGKLLHNYTCISADQCPEGTYANSTEKICDLCDGACASCTGSADHHCTACSDGYHLWNSQCLLWCPDKTFQSSSGRCQPCPAACQTCYGANTTSCLSCLPSHVLHGTQCVSSCPNATFHNHTTHKCLACDSTCATCNGTSASNCLTCKAGWKLKGGSCISPCPEGKYPSKDGCKDCHKSCLSCTGPSDRECSGCKGVKFLDVITGACSYECSDGYYGETASALCKPCQSGCKQCYETGECTSCMPGLVLHGKSCKTHCPSGTYHKKDSITCKKCDGTCLECSQQPRNCLKCTEHHVLSGNQCISGCPKGTYLVKGTKRCQACHPTCAECTGPGHDRCTRCDGGLVKVWSRCLSKCPATYFYNARDVQCEPCDYYCQTCKGGNGLKNCSKCTPPFLLNDHYCVRECPKEGRYYDNKALACLKCHPSCSRCIGPSADDCVTCSNANTVLVGFTCQANCTTGMFKNVKTYICERCHPTCASCIGSGPLKCIKCVDGLVFSESEGKCTSDCKTGQYKDGLACKGCDASCKTCNGPSAKHCLSCHPSHAYYKHSCVNICPSGTFLYTDKDSQQCTPCHAVCKTCSGLSADKCTSCRPPLYLQKNSCVLQCSSKFVADKSTKVCRPCRGASCPDVPGRPKNRSVQDPSVQTLRILLADPRKSRVLTFAVLSVVVCIALFLAIFAALQIRSTGLLCLRRRYTILKTSIEPEDEDKMGLMDNEDDYDL